MLCSPHIVRRLRLVLRGFTLLELLVVIVILAVIVAASSLVARRLRMLAAAREQARRCICASQLKQMYAAIESYIYDYAGYYPGWPSVNSDATLDSQAGLYSGLKPDGEVRTVINTESGEADLRNKTLQGNIGNWRSYGTIVGSTPNGRDSRFAPIKAGLLLERGYLASYETLYCPSAAGMKDAATAGGDSRFTAHCSPDLQDSLDLKAYIADGGREVFLADYTTGSPTSVDGALTLRSHYNYRPNIFAFSTGGADRGGDAETTWIYLPGTIPRAVCRFGTQVFPTARTMGSRAVMCDSFEKAMDPSNSDEQKAAGLMSAGMQAHQEGYNVLYGDGHVAWYGDPQQTISYMNPAQTTSGTDNAPMAGAGVLDANYAGTDHTTPTDKLDGGWLVWHLMDGANNVDKDADCTTP